MLKKNTLLKRIIIDPNIMTGKPIIAGTRLTVQYILGLLAQGMTIPEIIEEYKGLTEQDIFACLAFATEALDYTTFAPLSREEIR
jgi:uncharacterized protein (DUF433 family)